MNPVKVDFMNRLFKLAFAYEELVTFLVEEKVITSFEQESLKIEAEKGKFLVDLLAKNLKEEKVMLVDYEWIILPIERLKLSIVTERNSREFVYNF